MSNNGTDVVKRFDDHSGVNSLMAHNPRTVKVFTWGDYQWFLNDDESAFNKRYREITARCEELKQFRDELHGWVTWLHEGLVDGKSVECKGWEGGSGRMPIWLEMDKVKSEIRERLNCLQQVLEHPRPLIDYLEEGLQDLEGKIGPALIEMRQLAHAMAETQASANDANVAKLQAEEAKAICSQMQERLSIDAEKIRKELDDAKSTALSELDAKEKFVHQQIEHAKSNSSKIQEELGIDVTTIQQELDDARSRTLPDLNAGVQLAMLKLKDMREITQGLEGLRKEIVSERAAAELVKGELKQLRPKTTFMGRLHWLLFGS